MGCRWLCRHYIVFYTRLYFVAQVFHRGAGLRRAELLGEVQVALETFELMNETRMWKNIEPRIQEEVRGSRRE